MKARKGLLSWDHLFTRPVHAMHVPNLPGGKDIESFVRRMDHSAALRDYISLEQELVALPTSHVLKNFIFFIPNSLVSRLD